MKCWSLWRPWRRIYSTLQSEYLAAFWQCLLFLGLYKYHLQLHMIFSPSLCPNILFLWGHPLSRIRASSILIYIIFSMSKHPYFQIWSQAELWVLRISTHVLCGKHYHPLTAIKFLHKILDFFTFLSCYFIFKVVKTTKVLSFCKS